MSFDIDHIKDLRLQWVGDVLNSLMLESVQTAIISHGKMYSFPGFVVMVPLLDDLNLNLISLL
jgi:hypothetical protein